MDNFQVKEIKNNLEFIFNKFAISNGLAAEIASRGFVFSEVEPKKILFVGLSPFYLDYSGPKMYSFKPLETAERYPRHFQKFQDIAESCEVGSDWTYLDLLFLRERDQTRVIQLLNDNTGVDFLRQQIQISINILESINPDLIIICSSMARPFFGIDKQIAGDDVLGVWMGYNFKFDDKFGVDVITGIHHQSIKKGVKSTRLVGTPVLFTSALAYFDNPTKSRLIWQMRQVLKYHYLFFGIQNFQRRGIRIDRSEKLRNQIKVLTQKLIEIRNAKSAALSVSRYIEAEKLRDSEFNINEIIKLLLIAQK